MYRYLQICSRDLSYSKFRSKMQSDTAVVQSTIRCPGETQASGDLTEETSVEKPK